MALVNHTPLTPDEKTEAALKDATIYGPGEEKIGSVSHVHGVGAASVAIIDVGGFLGLGAKPVAVSVNDINFVRDEDGKVHAVTTWTKDELKELPEHKH